VQRHYSITCDPELAKRIETLAHEYDLTTEEVIQQLVAVGLEEIEAEQ
jgi:predicted transcriptional regulator